MQKSMNSIDWNHLRAFLETAETGSLSAAARKLGLTQPTLSRQVAAAEASVGVTLFERVGKKMVLTATGLALPGFVTATTTLLGAAATPGALFAIGFDGVLIRRNIIVIFMCLELMLSAANLTLVAFSRFNTTEAGLPDYNGQVLLFFIITVAAAEVAVGLAIIVALYRSRETTDVSDIASMKN